MTQIEYIEFLSLQKQQQQQQAQEKQQKKIKYLCQTCNKTFNTENAFKQHLQSQKHYQLLQQQEQQGSDKIISVDKVGKKQQVQLQDQQQYNVVTQIDGVEFQKYPYFISEDEYDKFDQLLDDQEFQNLTEDEQGEVIMEEIIQKRQQMPLNECLFCNYMVEGDNLSDQEITKQLIDHMFYQHNFMIPSQNYVIDLTQLLLELQKQVSVARTCITCFNTYNTIEKVKQHMLKKQHFLFKQVDFVQQYIQFYDFTESYPEFIRNQIKEEDTELLQQIKENKFQLQFSDLTFSDGTNTQSYHEWYKQKHMKVPEYIKVVNEQQEILKHLRKQLTFYNKAQVLSTQQDLKQFSQEDLKQTAIQLYQNIQINVDKINQLADNYTGPKHKEIIRVDQDYLQNLIKNVNGLSGEEIEQQQKNKYETMVKRNTRYNRDKPFFKRMLQKLKELDQKISDTYINQQQFSQRIEDICYDLFENNKYFSSNNEKIEYDPKTLEPIHCNNNTKQIIKLLSPQSKIFQGIYKSEVTFNKNYKQQYKYSQFSYTNTIPQTLLQFYLQQLAGSLEFCKISLDSNDYTKNIANGPLLLILQILNADFKNFMGSELVLHKTTINLNKNYFQEIQTQTIKQFLIKYCLLTVFDQLFSVDWNSCVCKQERFEYQENQLGDSLTQQQTYPCAIQSIRGTAFIFLKQAYNFIDQQSQLKEFADFLLEFYVLNNQHIQKLIIKIYMLECLQFSDQCVQNSTFDFIKKILQDVKNIYLPTGEQREKYQTQISLYGCNKKLLIVILRDIYLIFQKIFDQDCQEKKYNDYYMEMINQSSHQKEIQFNSNTLKQNIINCMNNIQQFRQYQQTQSIEQVTSEKEYVSYYIYKIEDIGKDILQVLNKDLGMSQTMSPNQKIVNIFGLINVSYETLNKYFNIISKEEQEKILSYNHQNAILNRLDENKLKEIERLCNMSEEQYVIIQLLKSKQFYLYVMLFAIALRLLKVIIQYLLN